MSSTQFFITGIGTDIGKSVVSAIFAEAFSAHYWKPVQAGTQSATDTEFMRELLSPGSVIHKEDYIFKNPMSPHAAAAREDRMIDMEKIQIPTEDSLIVEGAGGLLVPLNNDQTVLDLMVQLSLPVILVSRHYLGSINHTLMSIQVLKASGLELAHVIFIGDQPETESVIEYQAGLKATLKIPEVDIVDRTFVLEQAARLKTKVLGDED